MWSSVSSAAAGRGAAVLAGVVVAQSHAFAGGRQDDGMGDADVVDQADHQGHRQRGADRVQTLRGGLDQLGLFLQQEDDGPLDGDRTQRFVGCVEDQHAMHGSEPRRKANARPHFKRSGASAERGGQWGLNPRPSGPQPDALPIELWPPCCLGRRSISELSSPTSSGAGIRTPIRSSKGCCPAVERPPNARPYQRCRGPDLNWGHRNFQSRALPTELPRQEKQMADGRWLAVVHHTTRGCSRLSAISHRQ